MSGKRVFISFDFDNDNDLPGDLVHQAKQEEAPFSFEDRSLKEPYDENWKRKVRSIIKNVDLVIVICGERTDQADGVAGELGITREEGKPYFLLRGRRGRTCKRPRNARSEDRLEEWTWPNISKLISELA